MKKRGVLAALIMTAALALSACGNAAADGQAATTGETTEGATYQVGIIQLVEHPALDAATKGFEDALKEKLGDKVTFDEQNAQGDAATCSTIAGSFVANSYNLILGNATPALQAAAQATNTIPILGTSITDYATALDLDQFDGATGINVSGTCDLAPLDEQAKCIKELFPDAKNVAILFCSAEPNSKYQAMVIQEYLEQDGYTVKEYTFADSNDVSAVTQGACDESDVIYIPTDNTAASCTEAIANVVLNAQTPVFAGEEGICKGCGVATLSIDYYDIGYAAGEMGAKILAEGADPATMPIQYAPKVTKKFNPANADVLGVTIPADYVAVEE